MHGVARWPLGLHRACRGKERTGGDSLEGSRTSFSAEDLFRAHIAGMDTFAAGLLVADKMHQDKAYAQTAACRWRSH